MHLLSIFLGLSWNLLVFCHCTLNLLLLCTFVSAILPYFLFFVLGHLSVIIYLNLPCSSIISSFPVFNHSPFLSSSFFSFPLYAEMFLWLYHLFPLHLPLPLLLFFSPHCMQKCSCVFIVFSLFIYHCLYCFLLTVPLFTSQTYLSLCVGLLLLHFCLFFPLLSVTCLSLIRMHHSSLCSSALLIIVHHCYPSLTSHDSFALFLLIFCTPHRLVIQMIDVSHPSALFFLLFHFFPHRLVIHHLCLTDSSLFLSLPAHLGL